MFGIVGQTPHLPPGRPPGAKNSTAVLMGEDKVHRNPDLDRSSPNGFSGKF
jgi:hypothetical protein